jgi:predicted transcriptional regulator
MTETAFKRWRDTHALTQKRAAEILGISKSYVASYDTGKSRTTGKPIEPNDAVRKLMTAYSQGGHNFEPYPLH